MQGLSREYNLPNKKLIVRDAADAAIAGKRRDTSNEKVHNFAVPGAEVEEILSVQKKASNILFETVLQGKGTQVQQVREKQPDIIIVWAGNNDILEVATTHPFGEIREGQNLTKVKDFKEKYEELIKQVSAPYTGGAKNGKSPQLIIVNIPDITAIPLLAPLDQAVGDIPFTVDAEWPTNVFLTQANIEKMNLPLRIFDDETNEHKKPARVSLSALLGKDDPGGDRIMATAIAVALAGNERLFASEHVLDKDELETMNTRIKAFNAEIFRSANKRSIPLVDIAKLFEDFKNGEEVGGTTLNLTLTGGIIGYDGIHPTRTGHALVANEIIKVINEQITQKRSFGGLTEKLKPVDVEKILELDPQKPPAQ